MNRIRKEVLRVLRRLESKLDPATEPSASAPVRPPSSRRKPNSHLALIAGPFSWPDWSATFGDTCAMDVATSWFREAGISYDIACDPGNGYNGVPIKRVAPSDYTIFAYVCGPWDDGRRDHLLSRFNNAVKIGMNISILNPENHGFDFIVPRDMGEIHNPDFAFCAPLKAAYRPKVGIILVHSQSEYGDRQRQSRVESIVNEYILSNELIPVFLDTLHRGNNTSPRSADQLIAILRGLDAVISSRLHGLVFGLRAGVPVVAIDPIAGGAKVTAQAKALGWPVVLDGNTVKTGELDAAVKKCISGSLETQILAAHERAKEHISIEKGRFIEFLDGIRTFGAS